MNSSKYSSLCLFSLSSVYLLFLLSFFSVVCICVVQLPGIEEEEENAKATHILTFAVVKHQISLPSRLPLLSFSFSVSVLLPFSLLLFLLLSAHLISSHLIACLVSSFLLFFFSSLLFLFSSLSSLLLYIVSSLFFLYLTAAIACPIS